MEAAKAAGICADGYGKMRESDRNAIIDYYISCPNWGLERGFPTLDLLRSEFSNIEHKGVYIGKTFNSETFDKLQTYIFHDCKGTIKVAMDYDNAIIPMLYFANGCDIVVECDQRNTPTIQVPLYIDETCRVIAANNSNCTFYRHSINLLKND